MSNDAPVEEKKPVFALADNFTLPFISVGTAWWNIVLVEDPRYVFCSYIFNTVSPAHPAYDEYMQKVRTAAEIVCATLNLAAGIQPNIPERPMDFLKRRHEEKEKK